MKVGRISYTNTDPYFFQWDQDAFPLLEGSPSDLAAAARRGEIIAGPLPVSAAWELESEFEPLGPWGLAAEQRVNSVFLLSRRPVRALSGVQIGLTEDSQTSVRLLRVLLEEKHNLRVDFKRGLSDADEAWLVIGDQALQYWKSPSARWPVVTDLAAEWWDWQRVPFVFARWIVRKDLPEIIKLKLSDHIRRCLELSRASVDEIAATKGRSLGLPARLIRDYLEEIKFELGEKEEIAVSRFRELVEKVENRSALAV